MTFTSEVFQTLNDEEATVYLPTPKSTNVDIETSFAFIENFTNFVGVIERSLVNDTASEVIKVLQRRKSAPIMLLITMAGCLSVKNTV